ncbi:hypothetical protein EJB05_12431, partial [Eragrostis curvula]
MEAAPSSPTAMMAGSASLGMAQSMSARTSSQAAGSCPQVTVTGYHAAGPGSQAAPASSRPAGPSRVRKRKQPPLELCQTELLFYCNSTLELLHHGVCGVVLLHGQ